MSKVTKAQIAAMTPAQKAAHTKGKKGLKAAGLKARLTRVANVLPLTLDRSEARALRQRAKDIKAELKQIAA